MVVKASEPIPEREYLKKGEKEGWIKVREISMKQIIIDHAYQARVIPIDGDHVKDLADMRTAQIDMGEGQFLFPIVVFLTPDGRFLLADGFHRHEENRLRKCPSIKAYVVNVQDWECQARLYAAMCNRLAMKPRGKEDIRKALEMLFSVPEFWAWGDSKLGAHCGCSDSTVRKYRLQFSDKTRTALPETVVDSGGRSIAYSRGRKNEPMLRSSMSDGRKRFYASINGRHRYLGSSEEEAEAKFKEATKGRKAKEVSLTSSRLVQFFASRGLSVKPLGDPKYTTCGISGLHRDCLAITHSSMSNSKEFHESVGRALVLREIVGPHKKPVVLCYLGHSPFIGLETALVLARSLGIEFLTPEELVESLKGQSEQSA